MIRKWLALFLMFGLGLGAPGAQYVFEAVPASVVTNFNPAGLAYYAVASSGTNFFCVGSNSVASFAGTNRVPPVGGYLTNVTSWTNHNIASNPGNLYGVASGGSVYLAAGTGNATFTNAGAAAWASSGNAILGVNVNAEGVAFNSLVQTFSLVTASYQAAWAANPVNGWNSAPNTSNTTAVVESFRAVTTMGGSNLALCGIRGDIRTSTDGGRSWNLSQEFSFSSPDLNAIASDEENTLVCVGAAGTVLVSTNGGGSWTTNSIPGTGSTNTFKAATYTGTNDNQFLVTDAGGRIFMATNHASNGILSWYRATNAVTALPANSLNGATVALSGPMQGIAMLVGDAGTILIGGTQPPTPTPVNNTNCALNGEFGLCPNPALATIVNGDGTHPTNILAIDWFADAAGSIALTNNSQSFVPTNAAPGTYAYYARARDTRTGLVSGLTNVVFKVNALPYAPVAASAAVTNVLTSPYQTNTALLVDVSGSAGLIASDSPGATVTADWYIANVDQASFGEALAEGDAATGGVTNAGAAWASGGGLLVATNTLIFHPTNRICGTYTYWARARVINPAFTNCVCQSTNLTPVTLTVVPPLPTGSTWATNCSLQECPNPALTVTLLTNFDYPPALLTADWYDAPAGGNLEANATLSYIPTNTAAGTYTYYVATRDVATGYVSTNRLPVQFKVNALPYTPVAVASSVTNVLTAPYQINLPLMVDVSASTNLIATDSPGAMVTADWYLDAAGTVPAYTATNNADPNWLAGGGVIPATNTLVFQPTNRVSGTYLYWARARVINPSFTNCICQSTNLTPVMFTLIPPLPTGSTWATNCALQECPNPALSVTLLTNFDYPPRLLTADWYDVGGNQVANGSLAFIPTNAVAGTYTYYVASRDVVTGNVSANRLPVQFKVNALPPAPVAASVTNVLTMPYQINTMLTVDLSGATNLIAMDTPGATVTADWYLDAAGTMPAYTATNNADPNWLTGGGVVLATNTLSFMPTNRICGTYTNWVRTRVINPFFTNCICQSTNLTPVVFTLIPSLPTGAIGATNCALPNEFGECANPPLSVTLLTNFDYPPAQLTADWYDAPVGGHLLANSALAYTPTPPEIFAGLTYTYYVATRDVTTGYVSTNRLPVQFKLNALPYAPVATTRFVTEVLTTPYQTNATLMVSVTNSASLIAADSPGATVTADWYVSYVSQDSFGEAVAGGYAAVGGATNSGAGWAGGSDLLVATNTLVFHPTNRICGTYTYWVRARVINPSFTNCVCQSTNLTPVTLTLIPPPPVGATWATNCALQECPNPALTVTLLTNFDYPPHLLTADWYDAPAGGNQLANTTLSYTPTNTAAGTYTYYAAARDVATGYVNTTRLPVVFKVNALPLAPLANPVTNVLTSLQTNSALVLDVSNSAGLIAADSPGATVTADWYLDAAGTIPAYTATNNSDTNWLSGGGVIPATGTLAFIPTNRVSGAYAYYAQARVINTNFGSCACRSTNLTAVWFSLLPPAPVSDGDQTNCASVADPELAVTVFTNADNTNLTANWYSVPTGGTAMATNTLAYMPADATPGAHSYWVETQDPASGLVSPNRAQVTLDLEACTNAPTVTLQGEGSATPSLLLNWYGNLYLLGATNLAPPIEWYYVTQGVPAMNNSWSNPAVTPPVLFFRLSNTNAN